MLGGLDVVRAGLGKARALAGEARHAELVALQEAVQLCRENGLSVRDTADLLGTPRTQVLKVMAGHSGAATPPAFGDSETWRQVHHWVWSHDEARAADDHPPFHYEGNTITARSRGQAVSSDPHGS